MTLARRQALLAERDRRSAMLALAQALDDEKRSTEVAQRCAHLLRDCRLGQGGERAYDLVSSASFVNALRQVAGDADRTAHDAREQSRWQAQHLAEREERARRLHERAEEAAQAFRENMSAQDAETADGTRLARKLLNSSNRSDTTGKHR